MLLEIHKIVYAVLSNKFIVSTVSMLVHLLD